MVSFLQKLLPRIFKKSGFLKMSIYFCFKTSKGRSERKPTIVAIATSQELFFSNLQIGKNIGKALNYCSLWIYKALNCFDETNFWWNKKHSSIWNSTLHNSNQGMSLNQFQNARGLQNRGVSENSYKNSLIPSGNPRVLFPKYSSAIRELYQQ